MIIMKGPPLSPVAAEKLARYIFSVDLYALVIVKDDGRVTVTTDKQGAVYNAIASMPRSLFYVDGRKRRRFDVHVVD